MSGRHRVKRRTGFKWVALTVLVALLAGAAYVGVPKLLGGCRGTSTFTVAADASFAPVLNDLIEATPEADLECASLSVVAADPSETVGAISAGKRVPSLWIPDSTYWIARAGQSTGLPVDMAADSVATSPIVLVGMKGDKPEAESWLAALGDADLSLGDPLTSTVSMAPIVASLAESEEQQTDSQLVSAVMVPIAQAQQTAPQETDPHQRIDQVLKRGGAAVVSEQQAVSHGGKTAIGVPTTGSVFLNFPLAVTEPVSGDRAGAKTVGQALAVVLSSPDGLAALSKAGFRRGDAAPLSDDRGVGLIQSLRVSDQSTVSAALKNFARLALPIRALAVDDISGSMAFTSGNQTRMELTIQASQTGISLFPDNAQLGLWSFSTDLEGDDDFKSLEPIRRMDDDVDGDSHRAALLKAIGALEPKVGGGTGLYDTTLAAFREVKRTYDPKAVNSVILLTDGANDSPGSISLKKLLSTLAEEQDPTRPVIIITIGITDDADASTLEKISEVTGGSSFVARTPSDIAKVFVTALSSRAG